MNCAQKFEPIAYGYLDTPCTFNYSLRVDVVNRLTTSCGVNYTQTKNEYPKYFKVPPMGI